MAGRLVCQNCGLAAGSRAGRSAPGSSRRSNGTKKRWLVILLIAVIVLVVVTS